MGRQGDQRKVPDKGQPERVQGRGSQGGHEARLCEAVRVRRHLRRRLPTRARLPTPRHPLPRPQPRHRSRPSSLEIWSAFYFIPFFFFFKNKLIITRLTWLNLDDVHTYKT